MFREEKPCPKHTVSRWRKPEGSPRWPTHLSWQRCRWGLWEEVLQSAHTSLSHLSAEALCPCVQAQQPSPCPSFLLPSQQGACHTDLAEWTPGTRLPAPSPRSFDKRQGPNGVQGSICLPLAHEVRKEQDGGTRASSPLHVSGRSWNVSGSSAQPRAWHISRGGSSSPLFLSPL